MPDVVAAVASLARLPGIPEQVDAARDACTQLRWHEALRRRVPEAAAESRVRGAWASGELEGARMSLDTVRDVMRGAVTWGTDPDPVEQVMRGVISATAESERLEPLVRRAPLQALARLHVAAAAGLVDDDRLGRPRAEGELCRELVDLGAPPPVDEAGQRLAALADLLVAAEDLPAVVVIAVVHAEIVTVRPFVRGNAVVARAMERAAVKALGLDPTGVAVTEAGHRALGGPEYLGALTAYGMGTPEGVGLWISHCARAIQAAATQGRTIADAVLAGRLG